MTEEEHLYREGAKAKEEKSFEERYGKKKGEKVYGAVVGKVKREQLEAEGKSVGREHVKGHISFTKRGGVYRVKGHYATVHAHPHGKGDHPGRCGPLCRRGLVEHGHKGRVDYTGA